MALTSSDKQWISGEIARLVDARADQIEANLLAKLPAAVGDLKVNVAPGEKVANMQPWSRVDAYGSPERHEIKGIVEAIDTKVQKLLDAGKPEA